MITCSRCNKDNQDHYKFCLGCGAKLEVAPAGPAPTGNADNLALGIAKTAVPPDPRAAMGMLVPESGRLSAMAPAPAAATPAPTRPATGPIAAPPAAPATNVRPITGPMVAQVSRPSAALAPVAASAGAGAAPRPSGNVMTPTPTPAPAAAVPVGVIQAPVAVQSPVVRPTSDKGPLPGMVSAPASGPAMAPCPKCGRPVNANYAFCGSCGQRTRPEGSADASVSAETGVAQAAGAARTMFMTPPTAKPVARGHLTLIRPDGTEGGMHPLHDGENLIGRGQGSLFDADPYLSPRHAEFLLNDEGLLVRDLRSLNGVFAKIIQEEKLESGDIFRIGQELLRFDMIAAPMPLEDGTEIIGTPNPGYWGRISVVVGRDVDGPAFPLFDESIVLGRERGDILFPEDGYVSGTHAQITLRDGDVFLSDLGSSNGTFFRIRGSRTLPPGSLILMGQQLFRVAFR